MGAVRCGDAAYRVNGLLKSWQIGLTHMASDGIAILFIYKNIGLVLPYFQKDFWLDFPQLWI